jgi:hypothetical protein
MNYKANNFDVSDEERKTFVSAESARFVIGLPVHEYEL